MPGMRREKCLGLNERNVEVCTGFLSTKNRLLLTSDGAMKKQQIWRASCTVNIFRSE